jgi:hypothetical protein
VISVVEGPQMDAPFKRRQETSRPMDSASVRTYWKELPREVAYE